MAIWYAVIRYFGIIQSEIIAAMASVVAMLGITTLLIADHIDKAKKSVLKEIRKPKTPNTEEKEE
ncbi:MAG: hypothetical protein WCT11_00665 [Candidatus Magasanikbacteria bacterium]